MKKNKTYKKSILIGCSNKSKSKSNKIIKKKKDTQKNVIKKIKGGALNKYLSLSNTTPTINNNLAKVGGNCGCNLFGGKTNKYYTKAYTNGGNFNNLNLPIVQEIVNGGVSSVTSIQNLGNTLLGKEHITEPYPYKQPYL